MATQWDSVGADVQHVPVDQANHADERAEGQPVAADEIDSRPVIESPAPQDGGLREDEPVLDQPSSTNQDTPIGAEQTDYDHPVTAAESDAGVEPPAAATEIEAQTGASAGHEAPGPEAAQSGPELTPAPAAGAVETAAQQPVETEADVHAETERLQAALAERERVRSALAVYEENERLRGQLAGKRTTGAHSGSRRIVRRTMVGLLVVLSCLSILLSTLTVWTHQTVLNTDHWIAVVGPVGSDPRVINDVSAYVADQAVTLLQVKQTAQQALPPRATFLAGPLTDAVQNFIQGRIASAMRSPQFQRAWITVNRFAQQEVIAALRGKSSYVTIANSTLTLNLIPLIGQGLYVVSQQLPGLIPAGVHFPDLSSTTSPAQAQQALSKALGIPIPAGFGQITVLHSDQLTTAQQALRLFDALTIALPLITLALIVAAMGFSVNRRRTAIQLGIGVIIAFILARVAIAYVEQAIPAAITARTVHDVVQITLDGAFASLRTVTAWLIVAGVVVCLVAYLSGKPQWFQAAYAYGRSGYQWTREQIAKRQFKLPGTPGHLAETA